MLVLAGTEFIFFIAGSVGLCFVFGLETVLTIQGCFVTADIEFLLLTPARGLGVQKELWGDTTGTAASHWPKAYSTPPGVMLHFTPLSEAKNLPLVTLNEGWTPRPYVESIKFWHYKVASRKKQINIIKKLEKVHTLVLNFTECKINESSSHFEAWRDNTKVKMTFK